MKIVITGGAGFIGHHTAKAAQAAGHTVLILDNLTTGSIDNIPPGAEFVRLDVTNLEDVEHAVLGCDAILHLAAMVSVPQSMNDPLATYAINTTGTVNVLEAARRTGVSRVVLASSCSVYGDLPGCKDETSAVCPLSPYAASKLMAEQWTEVYATAFGLQTVRLRYFNVYGPRQLASSPYSGVIARWCNAARHHQQCIVFGNGMQTRDFVSVHDVAAANLLALTADTLESGGVYQVATGRSTSLNELLATLEAVTDRHIDREYKPARAGDILDSSGSSQRLQALGWRPQIDLQTGLAEILQPLDD